MDPAAEIISQIMDTDNLKVAGGASAALAGAMAAAMAVKAARLSVKKDFGMSAEALEGIAAEAEDLKQRLTEGAQRDTDAFYALTEAFRLPKGSDGEKAKRQVAVQAGYVGAARAPLDNAKLAARVGTLCAALAGRSNPSCASDVEIAVRFAEIALWGCLLNVRINTAEIKDAAARENLERELVALS